MRTPEISLSNKQWFESLYIKHNAMKKKLKVVSAMGGGGAKRGHQRKGIESQVIDFHAGLSHQIRQVW